jgi:hypothetical protein
MTVTAVVNCGGDAVNSTKVSTLGGEKKRERVWVENFEGRELREIEKRKNEFINGMVIESLSQIHESQS